ncbi:MAG: type II toxin-antitoxin system HicB family antitoxin [Clostridiales Family XIII bacterium]|jgi:predicted RNase H-like HicB family nuclease|nr:type II toxin-antitoxin system HicB family antitoxin [Clostridiales Family XIII bacterium]
MKYVYPVVFSPDADGFCVYAPDLPGCVTEAADYADGIGKIREGLCGMLYILERDGMPVPLPSDPLAVEREADDLVSLVDIDTDAYKRRVGSRAVRRTISIPEWMDDLASQTGVSLSQITQEALRRHLHV